VSPSLGLRNDAVGHLQLQQVGGGELHHAAGLVAAGGVLPQDGGKALRGEDGVHRVLQHEHAVAHAQGQGAAAASFPGDHGDYRHGETAGQGQGAGDGLRLAPGLGLQAGVGAGGVDEGDDGTAELLRLKHEPLGLAVALW